MKTILHIISSPNKTNSVSLQLGNAVVKKLQDKYPESQIVTRDVNDDPYPHLYHEQVLALRSQDESHTATQQELVKRSKEAIAQLFEADSIVISLPLYNFGIPSALKSWIDNVLRAGHTFSYSSEGPQGLVKDKKVYIAIASGAVYSDGPYQSFDFAVPYLKAVLGFIGITDIEVVRAEGLGMAELAATALEKGIESIAV